MTDERMKEILGINMDAIRDVYEADGYDKAIIYATSLICAEMIVEEGKV